MDKAMRLDRFLANAGIGSRKEVKSLIKKQKVKVNNHLVKSSDWEVSEDDFIEVNGEEVQLFKEIYYLLNKPEGYISALEDKYHPTVRELIFDKRKDLIIVGRLDIDTTGALLLTNNGELCHRLLAPRYHVAKKYLVETENKLPNNAQELLEKPMDLGDFITKGAIYEGLDDYHAYLTISEGKFHQVKRMFAKIDAPVIKLKRVSFAFLNVDDLKIGEYRPLSDLEIAKLKKLVGL